MSPFPSLDLPATCLQQMFDFARAIYRLKQNPNWLQALENTLPAAATIVPDQPSLLMGYDFHLTEDGPKLIEINNNAAGLYQRGQWLPQPAWSVWQNKSQLPQRIIAMFAPSWHTIAIMDEDITQQFMYPEMQGYAKLLAQDGRRVLLLSPQDIRASDHGLFHEGDRIDAIYNRHTDFYLESDALRHIRTAFEAGLVALNPHPRSYALIGDKSRLADIWQPNLLERCLPAAEVAAIRAVVPPCKRMLGLERAQIWLERKQWVFKPTARHGGKGVLLGKSISHSRFDSLDAADTVLQQLTPPSSIEVDNVRFKTDFRLYMHGETPIALAGRIWRGQVTNFRQAGSGWAIIHIT
ncbi:MAG: hypothetical protein Q9M26_05690 [Mariprofundales bacterium]|nr:hypothetical protein [Mariprofundales bacterium]